MRCYHCPSSSSLSESSTAEGAIVFVFLQEMPESGGRFVVVTETDLDRPLGHADDARGGAGVILGRTEGPRRYGEGLVGELSINSSSSELSSLAARRALRMGGSLGGAGKMTEGVAVNRDREIEEGGAGGGFGGDDDIERRAGAGAVELFERGGVLRPLTRRVACVRSSAGSGK